MEDSDNYDEHIHDFIDQLFIAVLSNPIYSRKLTYPLGAIFTFSPTTKVLGSTSRRWGWSRRRGRTRRVRRRRRRHTRLHCSALRCCIEQSYLLKETLVNLLVRDMGFFSHNDQNRHGGESALGS